MSIATFSEGNGHGHDMVTRLEASGALMGTSRKTLLIVDNNPGFIHLLRDTLDTCGGHRIVVIPSPDTARRYLVEAAALGRLPLGVAVRSVDGEGPGTAADWAEWMRTEPVIAGRCPLLVIGPGGPPRSQSSLMIRVLRPTPSSLRSVFLRM